MWDSFIESVKNQYTSIASSLAGTDMWAVVVLTDLCPLKPAEALLHSFTSGWLSIKVMSARLIYIGSKTQLFNLVA